MNNIIQTKFVGKNHFKKKVLAKEVDVSTIKITNDQPKKRNSQYYKYDDIFKDLNIGQSLSCRSCICLGESMSNTNTGGPAFPPSNPGYAQGMTMRDYFAAQALTGAQIWDAVLNGKETTQFAGNLDRLGEVAYAVADAMLRARKE